MLLRGRRAFPASDGGGSRSPEPRNLCPSIIIIIIIINSQSPPIFWPLLS
jgi:hypothetical protein